MAAMFITRNALLIRFSKSLPHIPSSLSLHKSSRLAFAASASNHSDWRNASSSAAEGSRGSADWAYDSTTKARRDADEMGERAKETMSEGVDEAKVYAQDAKEKTKDFAGSVADRAKEGTNRAAETAESASERAKEYAYDTKDRAKDAAGTVADKTREGAERTAEKTDEVAGSAKDALKSAGEKAKQTAQGAWETAKDATQKVKETVVGKDDGDNDDDRDGTGGFTAANDEDVLELRRRAAKGYGTESSKGY